MLMPEAAILLAPPVNGMPLVVGATLPVGAAVPTGVDGRVLLAKVGRPTVPTDDGTGAPDGTTGAGTTGAELTGAADGASLALSTGAALVGASAAEETATAVLETSGAVAGELATGAAAGELTIGAAVGAALDTGLVKVHGQSLIVRVVAWRGACQSCSSL